MPFEKPRGNSQHSRVIRLQAHSPVHEPQVCGMWSRRETPEEGRAQTDATTLVRRRGEECRPIPRRGFGDGFYTAPPDVRDSASSPSELSKINVATCSAI